MPRTKNEVLTIRATAEVKALLELAADGSVAPQRRWSRCWSLTTRDRMVSPFQIRIGPFGRVPTTLNERRTIMTGNALKNTERFEPISREAADKLVAIWRLALTESLYAAISPKNNRPLRYEAKPGSSFK